jgi:hypothetical protein
VEIQAVADPWTFVTAHVPATPPNPDPQPSLPQGWVLGGTSAVPDAIATFFATRYQPVSTV